MYWVVDSEVQLTWIKYKMPLSGARDYELVDACLCSGMQKLVAGKLKLCLCALSVFFIHIVHSWMAYSIFK